ncbi:hypothetical protein B0H13DRAFT_1853218 [Mycena leptocephala]|nr:hypothetical protein B0H13DRAFT_1853218 [Mycena leptocephala]
MPRATTGTQLKPKAAPERKPRQSRSKKAVAEHVDDDASSDVEAEPAEPAKRQQNRTKQVAKEGKSIQYAAFAKAIFELDPANIQQGRKLASLIAVDDEDAGVMEGSQFSTRAESLMYHQGGDLIGMTALAKAKLTRDAGIRRVFEQLDLFFQSTSRCPGQSGTPWKPPIKRDTSSGIHRQNLRLSGTKRDTPWKPPIKRDTPSKPPIKRDKVGHTVIPPIKRDKAGHTVKTSG